MTEFQKRTKADLRNRDEMSREPNEMRIPFWLSLLLTEKLPQRVTRAILSRVGATEIETEWSLDAHGTITFAEKKS